MREIKFRAWDTGSKAMWYEDEVCTHQDIWNMGTNKKSFPNNALMQFTGLFDKNGKEIWEGDVIKCTSHKGMHLIVTYDNGAYEMQTSSGSFAGRLHNWIPQQLEVIGNTYENPKLLETP